jgi:hypothetical protein
MAARWRVRAVGPFSGQSIDSRPNVRAAVSLRLTVLAAIDYLHGHFILGLAFTADRIDFKALGKALRDLWQFLADRPASKSK